MASHTREELEKVLEVPHTAVRNLTNDDLKKIYDLLLALAKCEYEESESYLMEVIIVWMIGLPGQSGVHLFKVLTETSSDKGSYLSLCIFDGTHHDQKHIVFSFLEALQSLEDRIQKIIFSLLKYIHNLRNSTTQFVALAIMVDVIRTILKGEIYNTRSKVDNIESIRKKGWTYDSVNDVVVRVINSLNEKFD